MNAQCQQTMDVRLAADPGADHRFLFAGDSLADYAQAISRGLALILHRMARVERPFSGIGVDTLSARFQGLDLDSDLGDLDRALTELESLYLEDAVYFHHPRYVAHLNCPIAIPGILAELISASVNSSVDTWDQSAGGTLIEQKLVAWTAAKIGLGGAADGVFTSGGTQSNLMALMLARDCFCADSLGHRCKQHGLPPAHGELRIFASGVSHFSVQKAAAVLGLGYRAVVPVPCDARYRMDVRALAARIAACRAEGERPMAVVATAGTTDFGSIDPLGAIAELCEREGMWLHTDAAYGCGLLVSGRHRRRLAGIERSDSVTVDYHKSFFQPVSCSALVVRDGRTLDCVTHHADYLNPESARQSGVPNQVDKSLQTTRRLDALKLWLTLRSLGAERIGEAFDAVVALADEAHQLLDADPEIETLHRPELSTLVFRYRPEARLPAAALDRLNAGIRTALQRSGEALVAATRVDECQYLKFTLLNPATTVDDLRQIVAAIKDHGRRLLDGTAAGEHEETRNAG